MNIQTTFRWTYTCFEIVLPTYIQSWVLHQWRKKKCHDLKTSKAFQLGISRIKSKLHEPVSQDGNRKSYNMIPLWHVMFVWQSVKRIQTHGCTKILCKMALGHNKTFYLSVTLTDRESSHRSAYKCLAL